MTDAAAAPAPAPLGNTKRANVTGYGVVKGVSSGDTLILMGAAPAGKIPPLREICLSGIVVPRIGRSKGGPVDQPWSWYAKEFLRKKTIGQQVFFSINFATEDGGRAYADVKLGEENLADSLVQAGLATVKEPKNKEGKIYPEMEALMLSQEKAQAAAVGMWKKGVDENEMVRKVNWSPNQSFFNQCKGKSIEGIVSQVYDGSRILLEIPQKGLKSYMITLYLAGVQCAKVPPPYDFLVQQWENRSKADPNFSGERPAKQVLAPFAKEAQFFVEARLHSRNVKVLLQGCDKFNNFFGTILAPRGNISLRLLEEGLASCVPWSAGLTTEKAKMVATEAAAKAAKRGRWVSYTEPEKKEEGGEFEGKCVQVLSGDTVVVVNPDKEEVRLPLASIRCPREGRRGETGEPYGWEAKEFLRKKLVGKTVKVFLEYTRTVGENHRQYASVVFSGRNVAEELVSQGYATLVNHRTDEPRSRFYDRLLVAENDASAAQKGVHSKSPVKPRRIVDLSIRGRREEEGEEPSAARQQIASKARQYMTAFKADKKTEAVVEYVFGGARLKVYVPGESIMLAFVLAGVRCPTTRDPDPATQALAQKAVAFTRACCMQMNVRIEVETLDRGDNFIGTVFLGDGKNLSVELLKAGLASIFDFSAEKSDYRDDLYAAEAEAKEAKREMWEKYVKPAVVVVGEDDEKQYQATDKNIEVTLTEIVDAANFFVHIANDPNVKFIEEKMAAFSESVSEADEEFDPERGTLYAGNWDGAWYRVRCEGQTANQDYRVNFIDYGNHSLLKYEDLRPLDDELYDIPGCARACVLAGVKAPGAQSDYFNDAAYSLHALAWGRTLAAQVESRSRDGKLHVSLVIKVSESDDAEREAADEGDEGDEKEKIEKTEKKEKEETENRSDKNIDVAVELVRAGWMRVHPRPEFKLKAYTESLKTHQDYASTNRFNIWEYGDVSDEESDGGRDTGRPGTNRFADEKKDKERRQRNK